MTKNSASEHFILVLRTRTTRTLTASPKAEFLYEIQTKVLKVFLLAIHNHLYSFAFLFLQTHATSYSFYRSVTEHCKGERRKT
jgi:hypothetical protein